MKKLNKSLYISKAYICRFVKLYLKHLPNFLLRYPLSCFIHSQRIMHCRLSLTAFYEIYYFLWQRINVFCSSWMVIGCHTLWINEGESLVIENAESIVNKATGATFFCYSLRVLGASKSDCEFKHVIIQNKI